MTQLGPVPPEGITFPREAPVSCSLARLPSFAWSIFLQRPPFPA